MILKIFCGKNQRLFFLFVSQKKSHDFFRQKKEKIEAYIVNFKKGFCLLNKNMIFLLGGKQNLRFCVEHPTVCHEVFL